jgi:hypothetical protein
MSAKAGMLLKPKRTAEAGTLASSWMSSAVGLPEQKVEKIAARPTAAQVRTETSGNAEIGRTPKPEESPVKRVLKTEGTPT